MIQSKEELITRLSEILSKKSFSPKAKDNLLRSIIFAYSFYEPPKYIKQTKEEYISEYLKVLEKMNGYTVVGLSELNEQNETAEYFRSNIKKSATNRGNLELVEDRYVPTQDGEYYCSCKGYAQNKDAVMFTLDENNPMAELGTIHHEMTHLSEGTCPFPLDTFVPFSFEIREMLYEGRATTRESYIKSGLGGTPQADTLNDGTATYQIESEHSYPLYGKLYQLLQIIFGDDVLEEFSKNNDTKKNFIDELKKRYPNIPVEELFSHIIYILSCSSKENRETLASSIQCFARTHAREVEWVSTSIEREQTNIEIYRQSSEQMKKNEQEVAHVLATPELLQAEYEKAVIQARAEIEAMYQDGSYTEEEYKQEMEAFETQGTLEYYREVKQFEHESVKSSQESEQRRIEESKEKISQLEQELKQLEQNHFPMILERVCLKNPSLETAFSYIEQIALQVIQEEKKGITETNPQNEAILDKVRVLLQTKENTVLIGTQKEKASLIP